MSTPAFFTDEDVYAAVAIGMRKAGLDAVSTPEAGRLGESDDSQLAWAAGQARVLVTFTQHDPHHRIVEQSPHP